MPKRMWNVWHEHIPIRVRLTLWYLLALAIVLILFVFFLHVRVEPQLTEQADKTLELAVLLAQNHIVERNGELAFENSEMFGNLRANLALYLLADDGTVWDTVGSNNNIPVFFPPQNGFATISHRKLGREEWRTYSIPFPEDNPVGWLQVTQQRDLIGVLRGHTLIGLPLALSVAGIGGIFLATRVLRPIKKMTRTTQQITANDLHQRIGYVGPKDEIGQLASTLDDMLNRLEAGFKRERCFTSDAAHELRTPLTALKGHIGVTLSQERQPKAYVATLRDMEKQVDRLIHLSNDLLFLARLEYRQTAGQHEEIRLADLLLALLDQVMMLAEEKRITLTGDVQPDLAFFGNMNLLIRLFMNLLDNAIKYTPEEGTVKLIACRDGARIRVSVCDTGAGIPADQLPHIFERFFRVDSDRARNQNASRSGAGLGLAIAREIAHAHNGTITVKSEPGHGSTFTVWFPATSTT